MGTIGGLFKPTGDDDWDLPDYNNETYRRDLMLTLGVPSLKNWHGMSTEEMIQSISYVY